jgi:hypothetical protein
MGEATERSPRLSRSWGLLAVATMLAFWALSCGPGDRARAAADAASPGAVPCAGFQTSYPGDGQCLEAPDPAVGFQFHYGPQNYDDSSEVTKYLLMPNEEKTQCVYFRTSNATEVWFNEYHARLRPGSHHMLLYVQNDVVEQSGPLDCNLPPITSRNLFGATAPETDVTDNTQAPENRGMAVRIAPRQQVVMQLHVINTGSSPILMEAWANIVFVDKAQVKIVADPVFFAAGLTMNIQNGQTVTNHGTAVVPANAGPDFRLVAATPHYHAHTSRFTVYKTVNGTRQVLLEEFGTIGVLNDPVLVTFDSVKKNPAPDEGARTSGAYSGDVYLKPGDQIEWECVQTNDGLGLHGEPLSGPLQFTEQAYAGEMCNVFGLYAPSLDPTGDGAWTSYFNP